MKKEFDFGDVHDKMANDTVFIITFVFLVAVGSSSAFTIRRQNHTPSAENLHLKRIKTKEIDVSCAFFFLPFCLFSRP